MSIEQNKALERKVGGLVRALQEIQVECEHLSKVYGDKAMEIIADYPLYVSGTSNISYGTAIAIALMFGKIEDQENQDALMAEYFKTDREHSLDDYDKWVAEKKGEKK